MGELKGFFRSFRYAFQGVAFLLREGRNFRFMAAAALYVIWSGWFVGLSGEEWALELLCCGLVLSLEGFNTALEQLCDRLTEEPDPFVKAAKDCAAGGVLLASACSGAVWMVITLRGGYWEKLLTVQWLGIFLLSLPALYLWVFRPRQKNA